AATPRAQRRRRDLEGIPVHEHDDGTDVQCAPPERERQAEERVLPHRRRPGKRRCERARRLPAQRLESRIALPARPERRREALVRSRRFQDEPVERDERRALPDAFRIRVARLHEIVVPRRVQAEQADEPCDGGRPAAVHPEDEDTSLHRAADATQRAFRRRTTPANRRRRWWLVTFPPESLFCARAAAVAASSARSPDVCASNASRTAMPSPGTSETLPTRPRCVRRGSGIETIRAPDSVARANSGQSG